MDLQSLKSFLRIAELGSFSRAADSLNQTQPTISRQISALEQEAGSKLFSRHRQGVTLTDAGSILRSYATNILRDVDQAKAEIGAQRQKLSGNLTVAFPPSIRHVMTGPLLADYFVRYPDVSLSVQEALANELEDLLLRQHAEVAILLTDHRQLAGVDLEPLAHEDVVLVGRKDWASDSSVPVDEDSLRTLPIISWNYPNYLRYIFDATCRKLGFQPAVSAEINSLEMALKLAECGAGFAVVPLSAASTCANAVSYRPIAGPQLTWTLCVSRERANRPAAAAMIRMIRDRTQLLIAEGHWRPIAGQGGAQR